jgi:hypothetical protein
MSNSNGPDWASIRSEYIYSSISTRDLAKKRGVPYATLRKRAEREKWAQKRAEADARMGADIESIAKEAKAELVSGEVDRLTRLMGIADKLAERINDFIDADFNGKESAKGYKDLVDALKNLKDIQELSVEEGEGTGVLRIEGWDATWAR